mgnify:CR=1 FL=1
MADHPHKIAAKMCYSPKLAARASGLTVDDCRAMRDKKSIRYTESQRRDPLIDASATRPWRTPSARQRAQDEEERRLAEFQAEIARNRAREERADATRRSLLLAARAARALGFAVRASKDRGGCISSYYCRRDDLTLRISDHDIPSTPQRDYVAQMHGRDCHDGYHGQQLIVDEPRRYEWLRRAVMLAAAGRM